MFASSLFTLIKVLIMKRWLFLITMLIPVGVFSQINIQMGSQKPVKYEVIDKGVIRVFYELQLVPNPEKPDKTAKDYMVLEIGEAGISRFYSDNKRRNDSIMAEMVKNATTSNGNTRISNVRRDNGLSSGDEREIFKNYPSGKITVTDHVASVDYLYEENGNEIQWQIETDTATILSYLCQKATTDFRGRHYEAWFTPDLPINDGPWKFGGLPGLILSIEDAGKEYRFQAVGLESSTLPVHFPKKDYLKTSRKEVDKIRKKFIEDPMGFIANSMPGANVQIKMIDENGAERTGSEVKFPYNSIELE
jgi:GLPGLI family protein